MGGVWDACHDERGAARCRAADRRAAHADGDSASPGHGRGARAPVCGPTRRDKIGRIWAPVLINGQGPFRLVLDTGASGSAVNARVAQILGLAPDAAQSVLLRGVTGCVAVPRST